MKLLAAITGALVATCLLISGAQAQSYPAKPVRFLVPFASGGSSDIIARSLANHYSSALGQQFVVENKAGGAGNIAMEETKRAAADGYTLILGHVGTLAVNPAMFGAKLPYDPEKDFAPITLLALVPNAIVARPDAPFNTLAELIAYAKKNPGKLTYGTPGAGSTTHLGAELLKREAGFDMLHAPFKGSSPAHTELMGGRIDLVVDPFLSVLPFVKAGRMKLIATLGDKPVPGFSYPTVAQTLPGFHVNALLGFIAPHGTPLAVIEKIQSDTRRVLLDPEMRKRVEEQGMEVVASTPAQFDAFVQSEMKRWARVIADAGIQPE